MPVAISPEFSRIQAACPQVNVGQRYLYQE
jgi:hypothetical protein